MNILHLTNHLNIGGISQYVLTLAAGLKKRGHKIFLASSGGVLLSNFEEEGIIYLHLNLKTKSELSYKLWLSYFKLKKYIRENHIEIIHAHSRTTQVLAHFLSRATEATYISTCHGFFKKRFSRRLFPCWGQKVIAISRAVKEHLLSDFKVGEEKIKIIHSGVLISEEKSGFAKEAFGLTDGPIIGIIARLSPEKGHVYLIKAMSEVIRHIPSAQLLIVGDGRLKKELVRLTEDLGLKKNVFFLAAEENLTGLFSVMDIFVLPSLKEGLGLSLMQAMRYGLPVVGSDIGGIRDLVRHQETGLLVKTKDAADLAQAILELLHNPQQAKILGENARSFIKENFSVERMVSETEEVYRECLKAKD